jgi:hypothetical protein
MKYIQNKNYNYKLFSGEVPKFQVLKKHEILRDSAELKPFPYNSPFCQKVTSVYALFSVRQPISCRAIPATIREMKAIGKRQMSIGEWLVSTLVAI